MKIVRKRREAQLFSDLDIGEVGTGKFRLPCNTSRTRMTVMRIDNINLSDDYNCTYHNAIWLEKGRTIFFPLT